MIKSIKLKDFKCFIDEQVKCKEMTILAGANASGKSSVIQALLLYYGCGNDALIPINVKKVLGIDIGGPKNLVSQKANTSNLEAFSIEINGKRTVFSYDMMQQLDLFARREGKIDEAVLWYLNAERIGPRMNQTAGGELKINHFGKNAIYLMDVADLRKVTVPPKMRLDQDTIKFSRIVEQWMSVILGDMKLTTIVDNDKAQAELKIQNDMVDAAVVPTLTGFGISCVLPIVVAGLYLVAIDGENKILVVENPEAHLHPSAQSNIGKFLAALSLNGVQTVIETHSEHIIDGARIELYKQNATDKLCIDYFYESNDEVVTQSIDIGEDGEINSWPDGFFDQKRLDLKEIFELRRKNADK